MKHIGNLEITEANQNEFKDLVEVTGYLYVYGKAELTANALQTVGGDLYVDGKAELTALKEGKTPLHIIEQIKSAAKRAVHNDFERQGYLFADNILQKLISKKTIAGLTIYKTKHLAKDKTQFVVFDGTNYSHGKTLEQAKEDLIYKSSTVDTSEFKGWKLTDVKPLSDMIRAYRSITKSCSVGTKDFCSSQELKDKYSVKEVIELTKGRYGNNEFAGFFNQSPMR